MALRGDFLTMSGEDLVEWINRRYLCGSLIVRLGELERTFSFDSGYCTSVSSSVLGERLGELLKYKDLVAERTLRDAFAVQNETGVSIGKILLMISAISEDLLQRTIVEKIRESLLDTLFWSAGDFVFVQTYERRPVSEYDASVDLLSVLEAAASRRSLWHRIREELSPEVVAAVPRIDAVDDKYDEWTQRLANALASPQTVESLYEAIPMYRFDVLRRLVDLKDDDLLQLTGRGRSGIENGLLLRRARELAEQGFHVEALDVVADVVQAIPHNIDARALYHDLRRRAFRDSLRELLDAGSIVFLAATQASEAPELTRDEAQLLAQVDGRWDMLTLIRQCGIEPITAVLTLRRLVSRDIVRVGNV